MEALPEYTIWDKVDIAGEISVKEFVKQIESKFVAKVKRVFPLGNDKICIFDESEVKKQEWSVELVDGKLTVSPEEVFTAWPQLRMAKQMLEKMAEGAARTNFENQARAAMKSLQAVKDTFTERFNGPVSGALVQVARPSDSEPDKQKYFDMVHAGRAYIALQVHLHNAAGEEAEIPHVKYTFR